MYVFLLIIITLVVIQSKYELPSLKYAGFNYLLKCPRYSNKYILNSIVKKRVTHSMGLPVHFYIISICLHLTVRKT